MYSFKGLCRGSWGPLNADGSAMMGILAVLVGVLGAVLYYWLDSSANQWRDREKAMRQLHTAQVGLQAYAAKPEFKGRFPCPDTHAPPDGWAEEGCEKNAGYQWGWLPWKTLGLEPLRDDAGTMLWYAVAPGFVAGAKGDAKPFHLGGLPDMDVAAVVLAPGPAPAGGGQRMEERIARVVLERSKELHGRLLPVAVLR
ncbi:MAG: hypothetical protein HQL77_17720 [Magnetococcales bacterium]|nr:hypothetical protein [Magnetococcales bacterium]